jgi:ganglioside-induced differentiation-associated protein 1
MVAIQKSLNAHYKFSIEDLTMGNAMRKSPIAKFALSRGLSRASRRCRYLMKLHPEFKTACEKKLALEEERRKLILSQQNNYDKVYQDAVNLCDMLELELSKHQFAATDNYSLADIVWTVFIGRLFMIKFDDLVIQRKNLYAYWQRMSARKSFKAANIWTKMQPKVLIKIMLALLFCR